MKDKRNKSKKWDYILFLKRRFCPLSQKEVKKVILNKFGWHHALSVPKTLGVFFILKEEIIMDRMLSGIKPSGKLTLGNYIGAIKQMEKYQEEYDSFIFVADMHAITVPQEREKLSKNIRSLVAIYIACGIDPKKNTIFIQSENLYHANASWVLECLTPYGELGRMTQFKDKVQKHQNFSAGLLTYPV